MSDEWTAAPNGDPGTSLEIPSESQFVDLGGIALVRHHGGRGVDALLGQLECLDQPRSVELLGAH